MKTNTKSNANKKDKKEDFIDLKPQQRSKSVASSLGDGSRSNNQSDVFIRYVSEYSGLERTSNPVDMIQKN